MKQIIILFITILIVSCSPSPRKEVLSPIHKKMTVELVRNHFGEPYLDFKVEAFYKKKYRLFRVLVFKLRLSETGEEFYKKKTNFFFVFTENQKLRIWGSLEDFMKSDNKDVITLGETINNKFKKERKKVFPYK